MARFGILVFLVQLVLAVMALISCLSAEEDGIRGLPRLVWVLVILLFPFVGPVAWFLAGRPRPAAATGGAPGAGGAGPTGRGLPERRRPVAPDDNPEFLRGLDKDKAARERDRELFDKWEEDLKAREDKLRREKDDPTTGAAEA
jgi:hypothetical protein